MGFNQYELIRRIFPLRRDIISDGYDAALKTLCEQFPLQVHEYPTGMRCWTWRIPEKWICEEAYVEASDGRRMIDQANHPLYVASYSTPVDRVVTREELLRHIHVHPHVDDKPPFIFHYYNRQWAFGCGRTTRDSLTDRRYRVMVRSRFESGKLKVGEFVAPGKSSDTFVIAAHLCHPAQANDGLSGVATGLAVMQELALRRPRYTYRMIIVPETIGSIAWLSQNTDLIPQIKGGLFLDMTGVDMPPALQLSYHGDTLVDRVFRRVFLESEAGAWVAPYRGTVGNDERQFNAPGVRIPMLSYARCHPWQHPFRPYREYHSGGDDLSITSSAALERSKTTVLTMIEEWDATRCPQNRFRGELFLAGCDLAVDRHRDLVTHRKRLMIMDYIDGSNSPRDIAEWLELPLDEVESFIGQLEDLGFVYNGDAA